MYKLKEHQWNLISKGYRSLHTAAPQYWNSLPDDVGNNELDLNNSMKRLKTFLCKSAFFIGVAE